MRILLHMPLLALACLYGCQTVVVRDAPQPVRVAEGATVDPTPLVEALLAQTGTVVQAVSGAWKENAFAAEVVMKGDGNTFTAVFLAPHMRLATITLSRPHSIRYERAPQIPRMFEPEYALVDLALANLETAALRRAAVGLRIEDDGATRRVFADKEQVAELTRRPDGDSFFRNLLHGYEYTLHPVR